MFFMMHSTKNAQMVSLFQTISLNDSNRIVSHKALVQNYTNGSARLNKGATRALDKIGIYTASPLEPLFQINIISQKCSA